MNSPLPNPFKFGDPVEGKFFFPLPELENFISQFVINRIPVVLIGPRRFGKTSFLLNLLKKLSHESHTFLFVDIFNITSHKDFLQQLLRALKTKAGWLDHFKAILSAIPKLRPKVTAQVDPLTGIPAFDMSIESHLSPEADIKELIQDVLAGLSKLGPKFIVAIDEFQKITEIDDGGWLEATLRTHMQQLKNISFIFTGSRRSVIYDMLNNPSRPLYKFCQPVEFPALGEDFIDWIVQRFKSVNVHCERSAIEYLQKLVHNSPNYVQMVCFHLVAQGVKNVAKREIDATLKTVVRQNAYAYQTLLNTLTATQQRVLRLAAIEGKQLYSKELLKFYEIASGAALHSAVKSLKEKEILDEEASGKGRVVFDDPLFEIWLRTSFDGES